MHDIAWLLLALPLLGFAVNGLLGPRLSKTAVSWIGPGVILAAFAVSLLAFLRLHGASTACVPHCDEVYYTWATAGALTVKFGILIDPLAIVMLIVVTGVG